jgi:hypothetical protein
VVSIWTLRVKNPNAESKLETVFVRTLNDNILQGFALC